MLVPHRAQVELISLANPPRPSFPSPLQGVGDCFKRVIAEEGAVSLWRGNLANVLRYFPTQVRSVSFWRAGTRMALAASTFPSHTSPPSISHVLC